MVKVLIPDIVTGANISSSNVALESAWQVGSYPFGEIARIDDDLYEVVAAGGTSDDPIAGAAASVPTWRLKGKANRLRAHDHISQPGVQSPINTVTEGTDSITYTITGKSRFTEIAFLNLSAASAQVTVTDPIAGVIFDETKALRTREAINGSPWNWGFLGARERTTAVFSGIPFSSSPTVDITVAGSGAVAVGAILIGRPRVVGHAMYTPEIEDISYSVVDVDPSAETTLLRRPTSKRGKFRIHLKRGEEEAAQRVMDLIDAVACFVSTTIPGISIYGFKERAVFTVGGPKHTELNFTAKGTT